MSKLPAFALVSGLLACTAVSGCGLPPRAPVDLRSADIHVVRLSLATARQTVCPGEATSLDVRIDATVNGDPVVLHTRRAALEDWIFDPRQIGLASDQGAFDDEAIFHPDADARTSALSGFLVRTRVPNGPAFAVRFAPSYDCVKEIGAVGHAGTQGRAGYDGAYGSKGFNGPRNSAALKGDAGMGGGEGEPGTDGERGPHIVVDATWVRTPFYPKVLAVRWSGDAEGFALAPADATLRVLARGGDGGEGGHGGEGGRGGEGGTYARRRGTGSGPSGEPGPGGAGGVGGLGGAGGSIELHIDARFPEIAERLVLDAGGGDGGSGGPGGLGGERWPTFAYQTSDGRSSFRGIGGPRGAHGKRGVEGHTTSTAQADVPQRFAGLGPVAPL